MADAFNAETVHERFRDLAELRSFANRLIALWDRDLDRTFKMKRDYVAAGGPIIWSYTQHAVELVRSILELSKQDRIVITIPLIRLTLESAMTAIWLYLTPSAARAVIHEGLRQRQAALKEVIELGTDGFDDRNLSSIAKQLDEFAADSLPAGKSFCERCRAIVDGPGVYATWRVMSSFSHAGMAMGDFYLTTVEPKPDAPTGIALNSAAKMDHHEAWLGTAVCMLLAALKVCDLIDGEGRRKNQIAKAAKRMGITLDFALA